ncbi:uncharacterized protein LOC144864316 [Branchiostoma floridae x Branchiostoma japonicum]
MLHKRQQVLSESESNWDSSDEEKSSVIETPRATDAPKDMFGQKTTGDPGKTSQPKPSPRPEKQSTLGKNSTSQSGMKSGISVFSDRGRRHDNDVDRQGKSGRDQPPYDFKGVIPPDKPSPGRQPPGKGRKGHSYDPDSDLRPDSSGHAVLGSWDDSEAEEETLAAIRANITKDTAKSGPADTKSSGGTTSRRDKNNDSGKNSDSGRTKDKKGKEEDAGLWPGRSSGRRKQQENLSISTRQLVPEAGDSGSETEEPYNPGTEMSPQYSPGNESSSRSVYPFHQGTVKYLYAQEGNGHAVMPTIADKSEVYVRRGVRELFGALRLLVDVFVILTVELSRFLFRQLVQNLLIGLLVVMGDHLFKPLVAALFNSFLQPGLMLMWNVATATKTVFSPLIDILRGVALQVAVVLRAFRLVEVNWKGTNRDHRPLEEV